MKTLSKLTLILIVAFGALTVTAQAHNRGCGACTQEQRAKNMQCRMTQELGLNDKQQEQVYQLKLKMMEDCPWNKFAPGQKPTAEQKEAIRKEMAQNHKKMSAEMKSILTPEQYAKWESICHKNNCDYNNMNCGNHHNHSKNKCSKHNKCNSKHGRGRNCPN